MENIKVRPCEKEDVRKVYELSKKIMYNLRDNNTPNLFGGLDEKTILNSMGDKTSGNLSTVFLAIDSEERIVGFILLKELTPTEVEAYKTTFGDTLGKSFIVNGYGVDPDLQNKGIASKLLIVAEKYAFENGFENFVGTVDPDNVFSIKALSKNATYMQFGSPYYRQTPSGRNLHRMRFRRVLAKY